MSEQLHVLIIEDSELDAKVLEGLLKAGGYEVTARRVETAAEMNDELNTGLFDVILADNMFGDILSDLTAELAGSLGTGGSINTGDQHAMAQAIHGGAPDIAGQGIANPTGLLRSSVLLFQWLGRQHNDPALEAVAQTLDQALDATLASGTHTPDLGGTASTDEFAQAVLARL